MKLQTLGVGISEAIELLDRSRRICVIAFHSLEDRIVKFGCKFASGEIKIITPKPLTPTEAE